MRYDQHVQSSESLVLHFRIPIFMGSNNMSIHIEITLAYYNLASSSGFVKLTISNTCPKGSSMTASCSLKINIKIDSTTLWTFLFLGMNPNPVYSQEAHYVPTRPTESKTELTVAKLRGRNSSLTPSLLT